MNSSFEHQSNRLQFASLLRWVIVAAFLGVAGLSYVYLKNQLHVSGVQRKGLEQQLALLKAQNSVMEARIAQLTSRTELQRRLDSGFIKLTPIKDEFLVRLSAPEGERRPALNSANGSQFRPVSHERPAGARR
jgi:hypothetical protein